MLDLIAEGQVRPVIDRVIKVGGIREAMRDLRDRKVVGKIVIELG
jgi:D-arabinose 1-dehydrogenase-like Zn-dependent alcohol dehydrogenase